MGYDDQLLKATTGASDLLPIHSEWTFRDEPEYRDPEDYRQDRASMHRSTIECCEKYVDRGQ